MKKLISIAFLFLLNGSGYSQTWLDIANKPGANFYDIQNAFYDYFKDKDITQKSNGYKPFKRWEYFVGPRVYPSGDISLLSQGPKNFEAFLKEHNASQAAGKNYSSSSVSSATWVPVGPIGAPTGSVGGFPRKAGRDNFITFDPNNSSIIYAGSAGGSLWKTTNGGVNWFTITDALPVAACSDLIIDPTNSNIMFLATGGGDDQMSGYPMTSDGVYKTTNGGLTWSITGLSFSVSQSRFIHKLAFDPTNSQIIFAATNAGIYRSTNGGTTWTIVSTIGCWDLKFHPTNPNIVYAASSAFYKSTNAGTSFSLVTTGIPTSGAYRMSIAVTPTNPSYVYVVACKSSNWQFMGLYTSSNDGASFITASTSPNIIGNACNGGSTGTGTGWYNLSIAASPINPGEIVVGGVNVWRSLNDGATWTDIGCWVGGANSPYIHADIHELEYSPAGTLYSCNDGGTFYYTGSSWTDITGPRNIAQIYKIGLSGLTPNLWITGHQDNGTNIKNNSTYFASLDGDGMDCFIDRTNDGYMYAEQYNGSLKRSINGGLSWTPVTTGITGSGGWVTPWKQDPVNPNILYCGFNQMFQSSNYGSTWTQMGTTGGGGTVVEFAIAPSNNQVIYVIYGGVIRKTIDGGLTWTNATPASFPGSATFITIDPGDANTAWLTVSGYSAGNKVYQTVDGGATWMNISSNLPNLPANCSVYEPGSNDRIYVGMDIGVYYKDNSSTTWTLYNGGLPNVGIMDMEMTPAAPGQLFAATYGRGVYQTAVVQITTVPVASFTTYGSICAGKDKILVDNSSNNPTSWNWSITPNSGVTISSSTVNNPTVSFSSAGVYTISMVSGNGFGQGNVSTQTLLVGTTPTLVLQPSNSPTVCILDPFTLMASGATTYTWSNGGGYSATATYTAQSFNWTYTLTGANGGCVSKETVSVTVTDCTGIRELKTKNTFFKVYPNPANDKLNIASTITAEVTIIVTDVKGEIVNEQKVNFKKEKNEFQMNISSMAKGVYFLNIKPEGGKAQVIKFVKE